MTTRSDIVQRILDERARQFDLPGRELDMVNTPNDWIAIAGKYLHEETRRGVMKPLRQDFEECLVKAAAVILAALEHSNDMEKHNHLLKADDDICA